MVNVPLISLNNGLQVPSIAFGPGSVGYKSHQSRPATFFGRVRRKLWTIVTSGAERRDYINSVENALSLGYRFIDYSFAYGSGKEIMSAINKSGLKRDEVLITSRVSNIQQFEGSVRDGFFNGLKSMGLEYIDLFMFHWPVTDCFVQTYREMEKLHKEGYVRTLGVANCNQHHLQAILDGCEVVPAINQFEVHPLFTQKALIHFCQSAGITVQSYTPLARNDDRLSSNLILRGIARKYGKTIQQVILRWHIQLGLIPVTRSLNADRQKQNISIFDFSLSNEEMAAIDSININSRLRYDPDNVDFHSIG